MNNFQSTLWLTAHLAALYCFQFDILVMLQGGGELSIGHK